MRTVLLIIVVSIALSSRLVGQDAASVIDAASRAMGAGTLQGIQYSGSGNIFLLGQAASPGGPWPRFTLTKYVADVNYAAQTMREEIVRVDDERPPRGGGAGPFNPATGQGGIRPIPGDIIQNQNTDGRTETGALNIWLTPHGFIKGAAANKATARVSEARGKKLVSFAPFNGKYTITGTLNDQNLVERVETRMDVGFTGDTLFEGIYSDYKDVEGVKFPTHI